MINVIKKNIVFAILVFFVFFIFFDLNWGSPFYFHPDERNVASSVSQLNLTDNLNPNFFAYGGLPIYSIYLTGLLTNFLANPLDFNDYAVSFEKAITIGRVFSSIFSVLIVYLIYRITKDLSNKSAAKISLLLSTTSVAYLQYSHFGTFEMWLSVSYLLLFYFTYLFLKTNKNKFFILMSVMFGLSVSIKVSSLALIILPIIAIVKLALAKKKTLYKFIDITKASVIFLYLLLATFALTNPYVFYDTASFLKSMDYESAVAMGTLEVFYTGSFNNTLPIIYQLMKVFPFLLNPVVFIISLLAVFFIIYKSISEKKYQYALLILAFFAVLIPQSILFVKWTRYVIPSISFIYILVSIFLFYILPRNTKYRNIILLILLIFSLFFSFSFIKTVRLNTDTRIEAVEFAKNNIESDAQIISEVYDLGIVPFNSHFANISLFNFYDLDHDKNKKEELNILLNSTDYIILPSQRILKSRMENQEKFQESSKFYLSLINNEAGFTKIYETPCDVFCKLIYSTDPIYNIEETINIFDRPQVMIFKKE